jgi:hypothetical protein
MKTITISGDFSANDFKKLVALVREIDAGHPEGHIQVTATDPEATMGNGYALLSEALPEKPGRNTVIHAIRRS